MATASREVLLSLAPREAFLQVYDEVKGFLLTDTMERHAVDKNRHRYLEQLMDTTVLGGKYNRGISVVEIAVSICPGDAAVLHQACVCGWAIEFLQAHFLIEDDIMDGSVTRRGKPCWYKHPGVTTQCAMNDGLIVLAWATRMLAHFLAGSPMLAEVLLMFHDVDHKTAMGQLFDVTSMYDSARLDASVEQPTTTDYREFTLEHYHRIVKFKTAYYTYHLPMLLGLAVAGALASVSAPVVERLACLMGEYFQVQDDFLDCFGDPAVIGKVGTDIQDIKCSWLAVTFLSGASDAQRATFVANYGQHQEAKVAAIKALYAEAGLQAQFEEYERSVVVAVEEMIAELSGECAGFAIAVEKLWGRTYKRAK